MKKVVRFGALVAAGAAAGVAQANETAVAAVTAAQADGMAVAGALTAMAVAIWGALYIKRKFFG